MKNMQKMNKKQVKATTKQKIFLIIFGIFLVLVILEVGLRIGGFILSSYERNKNKEDLDADYRILCLGESTTGMGGASSWPAQLEVILNSKSEKTKFKVFNKGVGGTNTAFILSRLEDNLNKYKPNVVITMMGINDGDQMYRYKKTMGVKITLLLKDLRVYKLSRLLWAAWRNKMRDNTTGDIRVQQLKLIDENPNNGRAYIKLGETYWEEGRFEEAREMFKNAIEVDPNDGGAYIELGNTYGEEGRFEEAREMFKKAIEIDPNDGGAYIKLGETYWEEGRAEEAREMFDKATEVDPNNEEVYTEAGWIYRGQRRFEEAREMFNKAIEINPNNRDAYIELGNTYGEEDRFEGRFEEAREMFKNAIEVDPNNGDAYVGLGETYLEEGRFKEAREMFKKAIEIDPNNEDAYIELGETYLGESKFEELKNLLKKKGFLFEITKDISGFDITKYHYQELYKELNKRGVRYIAMQYPTLKVNELKNMFDEEDITFVSNEENFKKALKTAKYEKYFVDRLGESFGHCTPKGNRLIAENVANVILEELGIN